MYYVHGLEEIILFSPSKDVFPLHGQEYTGSTNGLGEVLKLGSAGARDWIRKKSWRGEWGEYD